MRHTVLTAVFLALALAANAQTSQLALVREFPVALQAQPMPIGRVGADGTLFLLDQVDGRAHAFSRTGERLWVQQVPASGRRAYPVAIDVDAQGRVFVMDGPSNMVFVYDGHGVFSRVVSFERPTAVVFRQGALAADQLGGFYVWAEGAPARLMHYDADGLQAAVFEQSRDGQQFDSALVPPWVRVMTDGSVVLRPPGAIGYEVRGRSGESRRAFRAGFAFERGSTRDGSDVIFGTDVMADGRIICEVAHRTVAHDDRGPFLMVKRRVYVLGQDGRVEKSAKIPNDLGYFVGVGANNELFFVTARRMLKGGDKINVSVMNLR